MRKFKSSPLPTAALLALAEPFRKAVENDEPIDSGDAIEAIQQLCRLAQEVKSEQLRRAEHQKRIALGQLIKAMQIVDGDLEQFLAKLRNKPNA